MANVYPFQDFKPGIDPILNYEKGKSGRVLIVDNGTGGWILNVVIVTTVGFLFSGSYQCRMGWDSSRHFDASSLASNGLVFKSVLVKTRKEKGKEAELHVCNYLSYLSKKKSRK